MQSVERCSRFKIEIQEPAVILERTLMDQWLVRTASNWIAGPYSKEQVRQMILERKLSHQDEVCNANGYWIFLHEREEILAQLGIEVPRALGEPGEDVTETQTAVSEDRTDPDLSRQKDQLRHLEALAHQSTETTAVLNTQLLRDPVGEPAKDPAPEKALGQPQKRPAQPTLRLASSIPHVEVMGQKESSRNKGVLLLLVLGVCGVTYWILSR